MHSVITEFLGILASLILCSKTFFAIFLREAVRRYNLDIYFVLINQQPWVDSNFQSHMQVFCNAFNYLGKNLLIQLKRSWCWLKGNLCKLNKCQLFVNYFECKNSFTATQLEFFRFASLLYSQQCWWKWENV